MSGFPLFVSILISEIVPELLKTGFSSVTSVASTSSKRFSDTAVTCISFSQRWAATP